MKKLITQTLAVAILSSSLTSVGVPAAFAQDLKASQSVELVQLDKQKEIRNIMAELSSKLEGNESQKKALIDATIALKSKNIVANDLVEFAASGMEVKEATAFRAKMKEKLAVVERDNLQGEELGEVINEVVASTSRGSNFLSCYEYEALNWGGWIATLAFFILASGAKNDKDSKNDDIKQLRLNRIALEAEINLAREEGVPENSSYMTGLKIELSYMEELRTQYEADSAKYNQELQLYAALTGVSASVAIFSFLKCN